MNPDIARPVRYALLRAGGIVGGTMINALKTPDPVLPLDAATKGYVDIASANIGNIDYETIPYSFNSSVGGWYCGMTSNYSASTGMQLARGKCYYIIQFLGLNHTHTFSTIGIQVRNAVVGNLLRLGVFQLAEGTFLPTQLLADCGTVSGASTGIKTTTCSLTTAGIKWIGLACQSEGSAANARPGPSETQNGEWGPLGGFASPDCNNDLRYNCMRYVTTVSDGAFPTNFASSAWEWSPSGTTSGYGAPTVHIKVIPTP